MEFLTNPLTEDNARSILDALPDSRRNTYLSKVRGHGIPPAEAEVYAAKLYIWNGYAASAVDRTTGEVEVLLRNFIDKCYSDWNSQPPQSGPREWLLEPRGRLRKLVEPEGEKKLTERADLSSVTGEATHDDYVAGFTFGTWVHLLPKPHAGQRNTRVILWNEALGPRLIGMNRRSFQTAAMQIKDMRNRATHRRPLVKDLQELQATHSRCVEIAKSIDPKIGTWLRDEKWLPRALRQHPLP